MMSPTVRDLPVSAGGMRRLLDGGSAAASLEAARPSATPSARRAPWRPSPATNRPTAWSGARIEIPPERELVGHRRVERQVPLLVGGPAVHAHAGLRAAARARGRGATAVASASPGSVSRLARPMRSASSPSTPRPVRMRSSAWDWPMSRGRRTVPPSMSGTPQRRQNTPNTASRAATRRSHQIASSSPPATA